MLYMKTNASFPFFLRIRPKEILLIYSVGLWRCLTELEAEALPGPGPVAARP